MSRYLVVVESPAKARTIKKYLGKDFEVKASVGHVKDLPKSDFGVEIEDGTFTPNYTVIRGKGKVLQEIKKAARAAERVFLAPDPDREGEAIAWHIAEEIAGIVGKSAGKKKTKKKASKKAKKKTTKKKSVKEAASAKEVRAPAAEEGGEEGEKVVRVLFNEITRPAIQRAIEHPQRLDEAKYNSQQARRILDRLVGYQISPLLWKKVRRGLSAGRVQSVAVRLIVEREREIDAFEPQEYWTIDARLEGVQPPAFRARLVKIDGKKAEVGDEATARALAEEIRGSSPTVAALEEKERRRKPPAPFITSTLQQEAANRLRFTAKKTMTLAQRLYEGVELGDEGSVGLITYMRTDSTRLSDEAVGAARTYIAQTYGPGAVPEKPNVHRKGKKAQDAHEAIRPTSLEYPPQKVKRYLDRDLFRLYELIWKRFVACQMVPAVYDQRRLEIAAGRLLLTAAGSQLKDPGWLAAYGERTEEDAESGEERGTEAGHTKGEIPALPKGSALTVHEVQPEQHFTQPPPRFTEASLVKELEEKGIGRPSTYASILSTIQLKEYVKKVEGRFHPTELGKLVTELLVESFPRVMDAEFTAKLEDDLDGVEEGRRDWQAVLADFYQGFKETLERAEKEMRDVKREETPTDLECERCGSPMVIKWGRNGRFLACSAYPECKNTADFREVDGKIEVVGDEPTDETCEKCGRPMVIKRGRFGRFMACTGYPECKSSKPLSVGVDCPECEDGYFTERRSRRGKTFYGCSNYPECKNALWDRPIPEACPACGKPFLLQKYSKRTGPYLACVDKACGYKRMSEEG